MLELLGFLPVQCPAFPRDTLESPPRRDLTLLSGPSLPLRSYILARQEASLEYGPGGAGKLSRARPTKRPDDRGAVLHASLALKAQGCFDAQRVCNALLGGGAGVRCANSGVVAAIRWLLSQFLASSIHRAA